MAIDTIQNLNLNQIGDILRKGFEKGWFSCACVCLFHSGPNKSVVSMLIEIRLVKWVLTDPFC